MNKMILIFKHEFFHLLKRKGFIIMTLIVPILALLAIVILHVVSINQSTPIEKIINVGYVDESGVFQTYDEGNIQLISFNQVSDAKNALINKEIQEYFVIPTDYLSTGVINLYTLEKQLVAPTSVTIAISDFLMNNLLKDDVSASTLNRVKDPVNLLTTTLTSTGDVAKDQGGLGNFIIPGIFSLLFAFAMVFSSTYMLQGLGGEKENRLMEVLLSSVSTRQLLIGKILGLGAAGLIQAAVWLISLPLLLQFASSTIGGMISTIQLPASFLLLGIIYFILGYFLFAVLAAGVGAISPTTQEGQQISTVYSLFAVAPLWCISLLIAFPDSTIWVIFTIFPFTSPVLVMARLGISTIPTWEIVTSISVLVLSIIGCLFLTSKVFRIYLLMYGKRPKFKEILKNLKNM